MYKKWQKSASKQPPKKSWSPEEMKIIGWCMNKNIKVSISPVTPLTCASNVAIFPFC